MTNEKNAPVSRPVSSGAKASKLAKPKAVEVAAPLISSEENGAVVPSRMRGSYLTVDPDMDSSDITFKFRAKNPLTGELEQLLVLEDVVDSSGESGARETPIPLNYLTKTMGFTLVVWYEGKVDGKAAVSLVKEVGIAFYLAENSRALAPRLIDEKIFQNTPTYDMHDHEGDEIVEIPLPDLAQQGDKIYCTVVTEQFSGKPVFYTVAYGYSLTANDIASGKKLSFPIARGWLARQKPRYESITCQAAWITSGLEAEPPAEVENPDEETRLPRNALQIQYRRTVAFIGDQKLENMSPPHLRQSAFFEDKWCLNPALTKNGGDVDAVNLETYAGDQICFTLSGPGYETKQLGCVAIKNDGDLASVKLSACDVACFFNQSMTLSYAVQFPASVEPQQSPERIVSVLVPQFPRSVIEEATNGKLDLRTFLEKDASAFVPVWDYIQCSNACWMWITGKGEDDSDYRFDILTKESVTREWMIGGVKATIPRGALQKLADCSDFALHFAASFCDDDDLANAYEFPAKMFHIVQEDLILPLPTVREAVGDQLTLWNGRDGVTVRVEYERISRDHKISVQWIKTDGTPLTLAPQMGNNDPGYVDFKVPREAVIHGAGKTSLISYTVTTDCKLAPSKALSLKISLPTRLPTPVVPEATPPATQGGTLDLRTFIGDAHITINDENFDKAWWFALEGQRVWLRGVGTLESGGAHTIDVYQGKVVTAAEAMSELADILTRSELELLKDTSTLTFTCKVTADGNTNESQAIVFPSLSLTLRKAYKHLTNFDNRDWGGWTRGSGAPDSRDLSLEPQAGGGYALKNYTYSASNIGPIVYRTFSDLENGHTYQFSVRVRRFNNANPTPKLSLRKNSVQKTDIKELDDLNWHTLSFTFTATLDPVLLEVYSHELDARRTGNDYLMDDFTVKEI
ncbi:carbohydrate binding domain-containing protein [Pseudomonas sp. S1_E04]